MMTVDNTHLGAFVKLAVPEKIYKRYGSPCNSYLSIPYLT